MEISSPELGITARLDLAEFEGSHAVPVDYKRGKRPHISKGAYDTDRVQLCAQGLLLESQGYHSPHGILYFSASRERVVIPFDDDLKEATRAAATGLRMLALGGQIPPPLQGSSKCSRCSLASLCMPDEVHFLRTGTEPPRPLAVSQNAALPMYVQARGARVSKSGEVLEVSIDDHKVGSARLIDISQLILQGGVYVTSAALQELMAREIPVTWMTFGGWFMGHTIGLGHKNVELRTAQYRASFNDAHCLAIARDLTAAKIRNQRTLLRRNWKPGPGRPDSIPEQLLSAFKQDVDSAERARSLEQLLGIEGQAAARYFRHFNCMLSESALAHPEEKDVTVTSWSFRFERRNRRPPTDPVNALLSFAYSMLTRATAVTLSAVGFDPYRGFFHQPRYGRPALALDVMEPFRPLLADSAVLMAINNGEIGRGDFTHIGNAVQLNESGRKAFIASFERRQSQEVTHPIFGYSAQYRQIVEIQCRLLGRHLLGELDRYPQFITR